METYLKEFRHKDVYVVGDLMLDKYLFGSVDRISPEAPVPVINVNKETYALGAAANTANNIVTLGANAVLFGQIGADPAGDILINLAREKGIKTNITQLQNIPTTQKIRVVGHNQQIVRIDYEKREKSPTDTVLNAFEKTPHAIIISDYAKGFINENICAEIIAYANKNNIPIVIDPRPEHAHFYKDAFLITPNLKEAQGLANRSISSQEELEEVGSLLTKQLNANVLITTGEKGMSLFEKNKEPKHIPTQAKEVFDVSGAGDTVIASIALALTGGADLFDACILANHAAGIKVGKMGTAPVHYDELHKEVTK